MRVISGSARGRRLKEPSGLDIRPTGNKVKESIFNIIQFDIEGRRVLDLFAGSGQLGIEALSRGAANVVFVDIKPEAVKLIRGNLQTCGFDGAAAVMARDALRYLEGCGRFDVILADPPYGTALAAEALQRIIKFDILEANGIMMFETGAEYMLPEVSPPYLLAKQYMYGSTKITRFERTGGV